MKSQMPNVESGRWYGHTAIQQNHYILVFGGEYWEDAFFQDLLPLHDIWMFNLYTEQWRKILTDRKTTPSGRADASATVIGPHIYMFGGYFV